jgi:hypothetical protein
MSDWPTRRTLICQSCSHPVECDSFNTGMSMTDILYCSQCESTLLLQWARLPPSLAHLFSPPTSGWLEFNRHLIPYWNEVESHLNPCDCGGIYAFLNSPRCPHCRQLLLGDLYQDKPILKELDRYPLIPGPTISSERKLRRG